MNAKILEGHSLATSIRETIKNRILQLKAMDLRAPELAVILVGQDPPSEIYVRNKQNACTWVGITSHVYHYESSITPQELNDQIEKLNLDPKIDGILVQLPLPQHLDTNEIVEKISPHKDVDGFHPYNLGRLLQHNPFFRPCTPFGIMQLLKTTKVDMRGIMATVVGISNIVGRPMILELLNAGATVTACHRNTRDLEQHVRTAELLISATGKPHLIPGDWIKSGSIVIDVGMHRKQNGQWVGDVDFEEAKKHARYITPVPGGVGPMTVACLLENTLTAYLRKVSVV